jgi:hypothetical protein
MSYGAQIILDSLAPCGERLTTFELVMPRAILAEFNTHRKVSADHGEWVASISANSASSRAIPVEKRIEAVLADPWIPPQWGRNRRGMVATELLGDVEARQAEYAWLQARDDAVAGARRLAELKTHKQVANRLLEPFAWVTVIASATEWVNLFALRANPAADPAMQILADLALDAYLTSVPVPARAGEWHLPYLPPGELIVPESLRQQVSAASCARVSYLTHDGRRDLDADVTLFKRLVDGGHWSPLEHQAQALAEPEVWGNFKGWKQLRKLYPNENITALPRTVPRAALEVPR